MQWHIISKLTNSATQQEQFHSGKELVEATLSSEYEDEDEEVDFVLADWIGWSSEEEEKSDENDYDNSSRVATCTRSGRRATRFLLWTAQGKSWSRLIIRDISFRMGTVITFWDNPPPPPPPPTPFILISISLTLEVREVRSLGSSRVLHMASPRRLREIEIQLYHQPPCQIKGLNAFGPPYTKKYIHSNLKRARQCRHKISRIDVSLIQA